MAVLAGAAMGGGGGGVRRKGKKQPGWEWLCCAVSLSEKAAAA